MRERPIWRRLGTLLRQEGVESRVVEMFYRAVVQEISLYGLEKWVLSAATKKKVEWEHTGFLRKITGKRAQQIVDGTWETPGAEVIWEAAETQLEMTYIGRRHATVAQWVELQPILEMCAVERGYKWGGRRREAWWCQ